MFVFFLWDKKNFSQFYNWINKNRKRNDSMVYFLIRLYFNRNCDYKMLCTKIYLKIYYQSSFVVAASAASAFADGVIFVFVFFLLHFIKNISLWATQGICKLISNQFLNVFQSFFFVSLLLNDILCGLHAAMRIRKE